MIHRDQVHNDVTFDSLSTALLDTPVLQRLGRVYQLGYTHLVYRGGTHTRLSHVMGALHVAGRMVDLLKANYRTGSLAKHAESPETFLPAPEAVIDDRWQILRYIVTWAALLHDTGHVPLGHTLEDEFENIYEKHDSASSPRQDYIWASRSLGLTSYISEVFNRAELLPECFARNSFNGHDAMLAVMLVCFHKSTTSKDDALSELKEVKNGFAALMREAYDRVFGVLFHPYMADIVANTICADYLDYLRRDPFNVGLDVLKDDRVVSQFFVAQDNKHSYRMVLSLVDRRGKPRLDTCTGVVDLVRQRYRFAEIIYYHKTKVAASAMFAKAIFLIGKPEEVDYDREFIQLRDVANIAAELLPIGKDGQLVLGKTPKELSRRYSPRALMDCEIGDESLLVWLQQRAWDGIELARSHKDLDRITELLRGISLLHDLAQRKLYKVRVTINPGAYAQLYGGSDSDSAVEAAIQVTLNRLRKDIGARTLLEDSLAEAAGWEPGSCLLYVPGRKVQAKGIETMANEDGSVLTLGEHKDVKGQVQQLGKAYAALWKLILVVHPDHKDDSVGLSRATDRLLKDIFPEIDLVGHVQAIRSLCWFDYAPEYIRGALEEFQLLGGKQGCIVSELSRQAGEHSPASDELAALSVVQELVTQKFPDYKVLDHYSAPGSLKERMVSATAGRLFEGSEGTVEDKKLAVNVIVADILEKLGSDARQS